MAMSKSKKHFPDRLRVVADRLGTRREAAEIAGVTLDAIIRHLRGDNQPSFQSVSRLCEAAGVSMHWLATGDGPQELAEFAASNESPGLPVIGFAEGTEAGWYQAQPSRVHTTLDLPDPKAFAIVAYGEEMIPEGIQPGFLCICSPTAKAAKGDIVHLRRHDGLCALRLYKGEEKGWMILKAYTDLDKKGQQRAFEDKIRRAAVKEIAPVIFVKRKV